jgi:hypothetical protein
MQPDSATRILLALILVCLVILIVQGFTGGAERANVGRYDVTGMRVGGPVLVRTDTATGQTWKLELRGGGNTWQEFREPDASATAPAPAAPSSPSFDEPDEERSDPLGRDQGLE